MEYDGLRSQPECDDILIEMQNIFYQDLELHQTTQQTSWEDDEDDYLACLVYQHMQLNDGTVYLTNNTLSIFWLLSLHPKD